LEIASCNVVRCALKRELRSDDKTSVFRTDSELPCSLFGRDR